MQVNDANNKRIIKNTLYLYIRTFITMLISLYTSRIVLSVLGIDDYGLYNVVGGIATSFSFLSSMLSNATQRYLNFAIGQNDELRTNQVFNMNLLIYLIYGIVSVILVEIGGVWFIENKLVVSSDRISAAYWVLHTTAIVLFISLLSAVYESVLIARENMKVYAYMGIYDAVVKLAIVFIVSFVTFDKLKSYAVLMALMSISSRMIPTVYTIKHYSETSLHYYWDKSKFQEISKFVGWNFWGTSVFILNDQGINMLLNMFFGPAVNAARGLSMQVKSAVTSFGMGFFTAIRPQIVKSYAAGDIRRFIELLFNSSKYTFFLLWLVCLPIMLRIDNLLCLWLKDVPEWTSQFIIWILLFNLLNSSCCDPMWQGMQAVGKLKNYVLYGSLIYLLAFPIIWVAFKLDSSPVVAFQIIVLVRLVYFVVTMLILRGYVKFSLKNYINTVLFPILKVATISTILSYGIHLILPDSLIYTFITCVLAVLIIAGTIVFCGLNKDERIELITTIKHKLCRS